MGQQSSRILVAHGNANGCARNSSVAKGCVRHFRMAGKGRTQHNAVGLAKAYAFGQLEIEIDWEASSVQRNTYWGERLTPEHAADYLAAFRQDMQSVLREELESTVQIKTLRKMCNPEDGDQLIGAGLTKFEHMPLERFKAVKRDRHILPDYLEFFP